MNTLTSRLNRYSKDAVRLLSFSSAELEAAKVDPVHGPYWQKIDEDVSKIVELKAILSEAGMGVENLEH